MNKFIIIVSQLFIVLIIFNSCDSPINIFSVQQDIDLGIQIDKEIESRPNDFILLNETINSDAYAFLYAMRDDILISPEINYEEKYAWKLRIIHNDSVVNAFCVPGGSIYIYTGMLKYLDKVDQLAGLLAHLIAHNDQRQTTSSMTAVYGIDKLISIANANATAEEISEVVSGLGALSYNQDFEDIADAFSVDYLLTTKYACNSTGIFFSKLQMGLPSLNTFWTAHTGPTDRITKINDKASLSGCSTNLWHDNGDNGDFAAMIGTLP